MKNNKGFTLIELLAVLIVLIVIFSIVFMSASGMLDEGKTAINKAEEKVVVDATNSFLKVKSNIYPPNVNNTYCITFEQLINYGFLNNNEILNLVDRYDTVLVTYDKNKEASYELTNECTEVNYNSTLKLAGDNIVVLNQQADGQARTYNEEGLYLYDEHGANPVKFDFSLENFSSIEGLTITATSLKNDDAVACTSERYCIDETKVDTYTLTYHYALTSSVTITAERIVKVEDTESPVITVNEEEVVLTTSTTSYDVKSNVTVTDNSGENIKIIAKTNLRLGQAGTYAITYTATDSSGNTAMKTRIVKIVEEGSIALTVTPEVVNINVGSTYTSADILSGVEATGSNGENLTSSITYTIRRNNLNVSSVDTTSSGDNVITYKVTDSNDRVYTANRVVIVKEVEEEHTLKTYISSKDQLANYTTLFATEFHDPTYSSKIVNLKFLKGAVVPSDAIISWDLSDVQDNSIIGWLEYAPNSTTNYVLNITSSGKIYAPEKSILFFGDLINLKSISFDNFYTDRVTDMSYMFKDLQQLDYLDLRGLNISKVTSLYGAFADVGFYAPTVTIDLTGLDTSRVRELDLAFALVGSTSNSVNIIGLDGFRTNNVRSMTGLFASICDTCTSLDLSGIENWNTSNVNNMAQAFSFGTNLTRLDMDISRWNTSKVTDMKFMFANFAPKLTNYNLGIANWDVTKLVDTNSMFLNSNLDTIDLTGWSTLNLENTTLMFSNTKTSKIYVGPNWDTSKVTTSTNMFKDSNKLPNYTSTAVDKSKAYVGSGGYLLTRP